MFSNIWDWLRTPFNWNIAGFKGMWVYYENKISGKRKVYPSASGIVGPQDLRWLQGLEDNLHRAEYRSYTL